MEEEEEEEETMELRSEEDEGTYGGSADEGTDEGGEENVEGRVVALSATEARAEEGGGVEVADEQ